jgi:hypothetical protein
MDRYDGWQARDRVLPQTPMAQLITDHHYFAPAMLALATQDRWAEPAAMLDRMSMPLPPVRRRLGAILIRVGILLRDGRAGEPSAAMTMAKASQASR